MVRQQQFEYAYIFGAVCPKTGECSGLVMLYANKFCMREYLLQISSKVPTGRHTVVIMDEVGWHQDFEEIANVSILKLPPYSLELNPMERVWLQLKQKDLSNRCYANYQAIVDAACMAWNQFTASREEVCSLTAYAWALI